MPKAKRSEQGAIIAWFSMRPLDECEGLLAIVQELMRRRRKDGKPVARKKPVRDACPKCNSTLSVIGECFNCKGREAAATKN